MVEAITIADVSLRWDAEHRTWRAEDGSLAWRYADDDAEPSVRGRFGCSIRLGGAEVGGIADSLEALDALVVHRAREALLPMVDLLLRRANSARLHGDNAQADALMHELEAVAMRIPMGSSVVVDEDTRRALPDACDVDEPAAGDAFSYAYERSVPRVHVCDGPTPEEAERREAAAYEARERVDDDRSPTGADVSTGVAP